MARPKANIRELHTSSDDSRPEVRPVPGIALAKFKFKLKDVKSFSLVWSNKGGSAKDKLSIWSVELESGGPDLISE